MDKIKRILFPTDFSAVAENAFIYALSVAEQIKAEIHVVHVIPVFEPKDQGIQIHPFMKMSNLELEETGLQEFRKEEERLEQITTIFQKEHINLEFRLLKGDFLKAITDFVEKEGIDIIVMGTSGANTIDKKLFGSNTLKVIFNISIPAMAIPFKTKFTSIRNYGTAVMLDLNEVPTIRKVAGYLSKADFPMNCINIVSSPKEAILAEEKKREWVKSVDCPNVTVDIVVNDDIEKGLLAYAQANEIDILGVLHRNLPLTKRIFNTNHSKLLLNNSAIGLLIYNI